MPESLSGSLVGPDGRFSPRIARILLAIGITLMLTGMLTLQRGLARIAFGTRSTARVVACTEPVQKTYTATVEFQPVGGRPVRVDRRLTSRRTGMLSPGDRVAVAYFLGAPDAAEIEDSRTEWAGGSIPLAVGTILVALALAYLGRDPSAAERA